MAVKMQIRRKITVVLIIAFMLFAAIVVKLAYVQFVQGSDLQQKAEAYRTRDNLVEAKRGTIYDRTGKKLAISVSADSIYVNPIKIPADKVESTALFLSQTLELDYDSVLKKIKKEDSSFQWIKRKVDFDKSSLIRKADLKGVGIKNETQRFYPKGMLASHVLGFTSVDNKGLEGLELAKNAELSGKAGSIVGEFDSLNREIPQADSVFNPPVDGNDLVLTIDENIQFFCERELDKVMAGEHPPKGASVIMMNPKTGEILAMANRPAYDPNERQKYQSSDFRNFLVNDAYEPGSTFKIITSAVALEEDVVTPESRFYDPGYKIVGSAKINCWRSYNPHGSQSFREVMQNSCNPCFVETGLRIEEKEKGLFYKYIKAFGYGQPTGICLSGESAGLMIKEENLLPVNIGTISIGQGISVTPLQMVSAVSAVVNGGTLLKPQLIRQVKDKDGNIVQDFAPQEVRRVISKETSKTVCSMLESVVTEGTAWRAYVPGYRVGGKTGTAQKPGKGGYLPDKYVVSFLGVVPMDDPQLVCLAIIDEPYTGDNVYQGGQVAAPLFQAVMEDTLHYLGIVSQMPEKENLDEGESAPKQVSVPDVVNLSSESARKALEICGFKVETQGKGQVISSQVPAGLSRVDMGSKVLLKLGDKASAESMGMVTIPDLTGKRLRDVAELLGAMGLQLNPQGSGGVAVEQKPYPNEKVTSGTSVFVKFQEENAKPGEEENAIGNSIEYNVQE